MKHCPAQPVLQLGWCWASCSCWQHGLWICLLPWAGPDDPHGYLWPNCTPSTWGMLLWRC
jgi:hypothetical protein